MDVLNDSYQVYDCKILHNSMTWHSKSRARDFFEAVHETIYNSFDKIPFDENGEYILDIYHHDDHRFFKVRSNYHDDHKVELINHSIDAFSS